MPTIAIGSWARRSSSRRRRRAPRRSIAAFSRYSRSRASSAIAGLVVDQGKALVVGHRREVLDLPRVRFGLLGGEAGEGGAQAHRPPLACPAALAEPLQRNGQL